ncbi:hypothetical protein ES705_18691 [subsurface metagenome]
MTFAGLIKEFMHFIGIDILHNSADLSLVNCYICLAGAA